MADETVSTEIVPQMRPSLQILQRSERKTRVLSLQDAQAQIDTELLLCR